MVNDYQHFHLDDDGLDNVTFGNVEEDTDHMDHQNRNAYYDYAAEKSLSHADAKLFYHHHQLEQQGLEENLRTSGDLTENGDHVPTLQSEKSTTTLSARPGLDISAATAQAIGRVDYQDYGANAVQQRASMGQANARPGTAQGSVAGDVAIQNAAITSELAGIYASVREILDLRHRFMGVSLQEEGHNPKDSPDWEIYPPPPEPFWNEENNPISPGEDGKKLPKKGRKPGQDIGEDFDMEDVFPLPNASELDFELDEACIFQVFAPQTSKSAKTRIVNIPTIRDYYVALDRILQISSDGPTKSFAFRRLLTLEGKFNLYSLENAYQETADSKRVPHRDFYNVRKVDTHVHHSSCMNQKHLLRFIKSKMKKCPDEVVLSRDGKLLTLKEVFESINLTAYDLSIDTLDMHVSPARQLAFRTWSLNL